MGLYFIRPGYCCLTLENCYNIHNLSAACNFGLGNMPVEILPISQRVVRLLHFDGIRLYLGLTELFFLLLLPRIRPRFLILHLTIVYLPSVLDTNKFFPYWVLQNHTHITINIWDILLLSVFLLLVTTLFLILVLIRFYVRQKNRLLFGFGDIFVSALLLLTVAFI